MAGLEELRKKLAPLFDAENGFSTGSTLNPYDSYTCATFVGTVTYMSPERIRNESHSYLADIWSLGLALFECSTKEFPYTANEGPVNLMLQALIFCIPLIQYISRPSFLGYLLSEAPSLASRHTNIQVASSDVQRRDKNQLQCGIYGVNDISNSIVYPEPNLGGYQLEQQ
ncbi:hypothetical protein CRYUN_Cryun07bG0075100 [Craigia yunnanensis]